MGYYYMTEWSRTGNILDLAAWILLCALWWSGGWFLTRSLYRLRSREILISGFAIGMLLFIVFSNILAHFLQLELSFWIAAFFIFICGLFFRLQNQTAKPISKCNFRCQAGLVAAFCLLLFFFFKVNNGLSIFDDNNNLPLVSRLSAGEFPPLYYLNPEQRLDYHYGLHLFAASLVQVGGFFPWSAFDFAKAISLSTLAILTWLWFRRLVQPKLVAVFGVIFVFLATGTRWFLLFVPESNLENLSAHIQLTGSALTSGPELFQAIINPWIIEGGSPIPFPFAFSNGLVPPVILALTGYGALPYLTAVLLLLLLRRDTSTNQKIASGLAFSSLAITGEHLFLMLWMGIFVAVILSWLKPRPTRGSLTRAISWGWFLAPSLVIAFLGGGVLTEYLNRYLNPAPSFQSGVGFGGVSLRIPPAVISAHLGNLSLFEPAQLFVAALEIGPLILMAVPVFYFSTKRIMRDKIPYMGMAIAAAIGLVVPLMFQLTLRDRDISRMTGMALFLLIILGFPLTVLIWKNAGDLLKTFLACGYAVSIIGGLAMLPSLLVAAVHPQRSYFIAQLDQQVAEIYWNTLEREVAIFDPAYIYRPAVVFASSAGRAYQDILTPYPSFAALLSNPDPLQAANQGYDYYYLDQETWDNLTPEIQTAFSNDCVKSITEVKSEDGDFRILYDLRGCQR